MIDEYVEEVPAFVDSIELGGMVSFGLYLNNYLGNLFRNAGFKVELCDEIEEEVVVPRKKLTDTLRRNLGMKETNSRLNRLLRNYGLKDDLPKLNDFESFQGHLEGEYDPGLRGIPLFGKNLVRQKASMYVLLAQKPC